MILIIASKVCLHDTFVYEEGANVSASVRDLSLSLTVKRCLCSCSQCIRTTPLLVSLHSPD